MRLLVNAGMCLLILLTGCESIKVQSIKPSLLPQWPGPITLAGLATDYAVSLEDECEDPVDDQKSRTVLETVADVFAIPWNLAMVVIGPPVILATMLYDQTTDFEATEMKVSRYLDSKQFGPPARQTQRIAGQVVDLGPTPLVVFGCKTPTSAGLPVSPTG